MKPEEKARKKIDQMFTDAGWLVVDRNEYAPNLTAVAVREALLKGNREADYFLFLNGKAVGVLEAKREEIDVHSSVVCEQATMYARIVPDYYQAYANPLPFIYQSNGVVVTFNDFRNPNSEYIDINRIHTPKEIAEMLGITDTFVAIPPLTPKERKALRACQVQAIEGLESSFRTGREKALMVLATGAGKTYTACMATYRMLRYTSMRLNSSNRLVVAIKQMNRSVLYLNS